MLNRLRAVCGPVFVLLASALALAYPSVYPTGTTIYDPDKTWSGYTVFGTPEQQGAVLVDVNGPRAAGGDEDGARAGANWKPWAWRVTSIRRTSAST